MKADKLSSNFPIVDDAGLPTRPFAMNWQNLIDDVASTVVGGEGAAWAAATGTEDRTALAAYAGQVVSNPPTQAEVQALDNAVVALSRHVVAAINDLRANRALNS